MNKGSWENSLNIVKLILGAQNKIMGQWCTIQMHLCELAAKVVSQLIQVTNDTAYYAQGSPTIGKRTSLSVKVL